MSFAASRIPNARGETQRRELIHHLGRDVAAAHVARRVGRRRRRRLRHARSAFFGSLGGGGALGFSTRCTQTAVSPPSLLRWKSTDVVSSSKCTLPSVVLPGVDDGDLAGRALGLALPGQVGGDETEGGQAPLQCCGFAGHDATPWLDGLETIGAAAFFWLRRRRVTKQAEHDHQHRHQEDRRVEPDDVLLAGVGDRHVGLDVGLARCRPRRRRASARCRAPAGRCRRRGSPRPR